MTTLNVTTTPATLTVTTATTGATLTQTTLGAGAALQVALTVNATFGSTGAAPIVSPLAAAITATLSSKGQLIVHGPPNLPPQATRLVPSIALTMATPALVSFTPGQASTNPPPAISPRTPPLWAKSFSSATASGTVRANPDPVWNSNTSSWSSQPPSTGVGQGRWTVNDLTDPRTSPGGTYLLSSWPADGSTPLAPAFTSTAPFQPTVASYTRLNKDGTQVDYPIVIHFQDEDCPSMWANLGSLLTPPFSIIAVALFTTFHNAGKMNYICDAGGAPPGGLTTVPADDVTFSESLGYRTALLAHPTQLEATTDTSSVPNELIVHLVDDAKPRMFFMVVNGSSSMMGHYGSSGKFIKTGAFSVHAAQPELVLGRAQGFIGPNFAANMLLMELRVFTSAVPLTTLDDQYNQLSSTWQFGSFV